MSKPANKRPRILQVCHDYKGPFVSICQQYVAAYPDHDVTTIFLKGPADQSVSESIGGYAVGYLNCSKRSLRGIKLNPLRQLAALFSDQDYELVIAHRYKAIYLVGLLSYYCRVPVMLGVVHEHEVFSRKTRQLFVTFWRRSYQIAGVSSSVTDNIAKYCPQLVESERLHSLPNAMDLNKEVDILSRAESRAKLGLAEHELVIGTIGRLVDKKDQSLLIRAFAELGDPNLKLLIVGGGPNHEMLSGLSESLGVAARVIFTGHVDQAYKVVRAMDLFVLSSGQAEGFGLVLLEAMLAKVPVLASDAKGPSEVIGDTGPVFRAGDLGDLVLKIHHSLAQENHQRTAMIERAYRRVSEQFSYENLRLRLTALNLLQHDKH